MENKVLSKAEIDELKKVFEMFDGLADIHNANVPKEPEEVNGDSDEAILQRIQTVMVISYVKEAFEAVSGIRFFLESDAETLKKTVTNDGEISLKESEKKLLFKKLMESIDCESAGGLAELLENILG